jgi:hypothetical protein
MLAGPNKGCQQAALQHKKTGNLLVCIVKFTTNTMIIYPTPQQGGDGAALQLLVPVGLLSEQCTTPANVSTGSDSQALRHSDPPLGPPGSQCAPLRGPRRPAGSPGRSGRPARAALLRCCCCSAAVAAVLLCATALLCSYAAVQLCCCCTAAMLLYCCDAAVLLRCCCRCSATALLLCCCCLLQTVCAVCYKL